MGVITDLKFQKKKDRVNLFVDGKFALGLPLEIVYKAKLSIGRKISRRRLEKLAQESGLEKVLNKVYRFLSFRPRSRKEIERYLRGKKVGEVFKNLVIRQLERQGYVDDWKFACWWVEQRIEGRPVSKEILKRELFQKGISPKISSKIIQSLLPPPNLLALKVAQKKAERYKDLPLAELRRKLTRILARRGFDWETIKETVDKIQKSR